MLSVPPVIVATFDAPSLLDLLSYTISILFVSGSKAVAFPLVFAEVTAAFVPKAILLSVPPVTVPTTASKGSPEVVLFL